MIDLVFIINPSRNCKRLPSQFEGMAIFHLVPGRSRPTFEMELGECNEPRSTDSVSGAAKRHQIQSGAKPHHGTRVDSAGRRGEAPGPARHSACQPAPSP